MHLAFQEFCAPDVTRCATAKIGIALADGQIVALHKTGVQGGEILGVKKCFLQIWRLPRRSLRSGRIKPVLRPDAPDRYLLIKVQVIGRAFSCHVSFKRDVLWIFPDTDAVTWSVEVWDKGVLGTHGNLKSFVFEQLDELLEEFLNAYLPGKSGITCEALPKCVLSSAATHAPHLCRP